MLTLLNISNIALIDELRVEFEPGLNLLTGETGSGKSIIVDALGLLIGGRFASDLLKAGAALASGGVSMSVDDTFPRTKKSDLLVLKELAESGAFRPVIDRRYPLDEIVEAHRYVDLGHKKGNVIVTIAPR